MPWNVWHTVNFMLLIIWGFLEVLCGIWCRAMWPCRTDGIFSCHLCAAMLAHRLSSHQLGCQRLLGKPIRIHNSAMCSRHRTYIFRKRDCIRAAGAALHGSAGGLAHCPRKPARFCLSQEQSVVKRCSSLVLQCFWRTSFFNQPNSVFEQSGEFWCVYKSWSPG